MSLFKKQLIPDTVQDSEQNPRLEVTTPPVRKLNKKLPKRYPSWSEKPAKTSNGTGTRFKMPLSPPREDVDTGSNSLSSPDEMSSPEVTNTLPVPFGQDEIPASPDSYLPPPVRRIRGGNSITLPISQNDASNPDLVEPDPPEPFSPRNTTNHTDLGNAERFVARHGKNVRYIAALKVWMHWDGTHWQMDAAESLHGLVKETIRSIAKEADSEADTGSTGTTIIGNTPHLTSRHQMRLISGESNN